MPKKFNPKPGQVDFTNARWAPVINCVVRHKGKILIIERSKKLNFYPGYYNGVSGFLDDGKSLKEKVEEELKEEIGIYPKDIIRIRLGQIFDQDELKYKKTWIVHPVMVDAKTNKVKLDWEGAGYKWIKPKETVRFDLLPGFDLVIKTFFG